MVTSELIEYVKKRRSQGISDIQIYKELKSHGWSKKDLSHVFHSSKRESFTLLSTISKIMSLRRFVLNKWSLSIIGFLLIAGASVFYLYIYAPYHQLQQTIYALSATSALSYSGKSTVVLSPKKPIKTITLNFNGVADLTAAPTQSQSTISITSQGFTPNFRGQAKLIRSNQTEFLNIRNLKNIPLTDPNNSLNHWYIVSSNSAQLTSFQQFLPLLIKKRLITITAFKAINNLHKIDFQISNDQLSRLNTTTSLDHITGSVWVDTHNFPKRLVFYAYIPNLTHWIIQADISLNKINKQATIKQPSAISNIQSDTSIYYLLKIVRSVLGS